MTTPEIPNLKDHRPSRRVVKFALRMLDAGIDLQVQAHPRCVVAMRSPQGRQAALKWSEIDALAPELAGALHATVARKLIQGDNTVDEDHFNGKAR